MLRHLSVALASALVACLGFAAPAAAASLGVTANPALGFSLTGAVEIADDGTSLVANNAFGGALGSVGIPGLTDNAFDLLIVGDSLDAPSPAASLFIDGADGSVEGELVDFLVGASLINLLFDVVSDDFGLFGAKLLVVVSGDFSVDLIATDASVAINAATPIPAPATLPLLAAALAAGAALRRTRAAQS